VLAQKLVCFLIGHIAPLEIIDGTQRGTSGHAVDIPKSGVTCLLPW
jgi:hypothetical protein